LLSVFLLLHISDLKAKIWTEGDPPFHRMPDVAVAVALYQLNADDVVPYNKKPCDTAGTPMPDALWKLVQSCFNHKASMRPDVSAIAEILSGMKLPAPGGTNAHAISAGSTSN
jgi:hypothetical protein